jgi:hypothetical protein
MYKETPQIEPQEDAHATLRAIYQNPDVPLRMRLTAAVAAIGFEKPKLAAIATFKSGDDFGVHLERAIIASNAARQPMKTIEARTTNGHHPSPNEVSSARMGKSFQPLILSR